MWHIEDTSEKLLKRDVQNVHDPTNYAYSMGFRRVVTIMHDPLVVTQLTSDAKLC